MTTRIVTAICLVLFASAAFAQAPNLATLRVTVFGQRLPSFDLLLAFAMRGSSLQT